MSEVIRVNEEMEGGNFKEDDSAAKDKEFLRFQEILKHKVRPPCESSISEKEEE